MFSSSQCTDTMVVTFILESQVSHLKIRTGAGVGCNVNVPSEQNACGDQEYFNVWDDLLPPLSNDFKRAFGDPLGQRYLTPSGYSRLTKSLMDIGCWILLVLEGAYNNKATGHGLGSCVQMLLENTVISPTETAIETIEKVRKLLAPHWPCLVRKADTTEQKLFIIQRQAIKIQELQEQAASIIERQAMKLLELQEQAADQASTIIVVLLIL